MKKPLLIFSLLFTTFGFAQSGQGKLNWSENNVIVSNITFQVPQFQVENFSFDIGTKQVSYKEIIKTNGSVNLNSFKFNDVQYENIDINTYKDIDKNNVPTELKFIVENSTDRGVNAILLKFNPIIKSGSGYKKVKSFSYTYNPSNFANKNFAKNGVISSSLASGDWFKFNAIETGVYKIDKNFLTQLGIPVGVDPRTIKIHSFGGAMLPLKNAQNLYFDNPEIAIQIVGESDGQFNDGDYILFYSKGNKGWSEENLTNHNLYDRNAYYYITYGNGAGKRIENLQQPTQSATVNFSSFDEQVFHEQNLKNLANLSRKWFGEEYNVNNSDSKQFDLVLADLSKPVNVEVNVAAVSSNSSSFNFVVNGQSFGSVDLLGITSSSGGFEKSLRQNLNLTSSTLKFDLAFNNNGVPSAKGYLDYINVNYTKKLEGYGRQFGFRVKEAANQIGIGSYSIANASSINAIWDVSDLQNVKQIATNESNSLSFKANLGSVAEYQSVVLSDLFVPQMVANSRVANQNLKGTIFADGDIDYLILTSNDLKPAADRLAQFHKTNANLNVKVVLLNTIYEEFSSGKQDVVAIRNFVRYVYQNASSSEKRVKYLNMFGDTNYDYLNAESIKNKVPSFYSLGRKSTVTDNFNDQSSFLTDDFFTLMDDDEGLIVGQDYSGLDIAVGRIPVSNLHEANVIVDKIVSYHSIENTGRWKNNYIALADDVDALGDKSLEITLNETVDELVSRNPFFNVNKIYTDAYRQETSAGGSRYPKAKSDFLQAINAGALMVNYLGHGGEYGLAQERLLEMNNIDELTNGNRLPMFAIITCEFTRFDNTKEISGGERLFLKSNGGAISLLATTRKIFITNANLFTKRFSENMFNSVNYSQLSVAEILRITKNQFSDNEKAVVFFIGDPALKLAIPKPKVELTHINNAEITTATPPIKALDLVKLGGAVTDGNNNVLTNFNGDLAIQIFDKDIDRQTLANDGVGDATGPFKMDFKTLGETIFRGNASVKDGKFEIEFVVPKDIKLAVAEGKVSFYATNSGTILDDHTGYNRTIKIGGVNENAAQDNNPPTIQLYMNDEAFISGGITNDSPLLLAHLEDENGMNTASGIGHDMVGILDGDENNPFVLNEYYETEPNNFRKGLIKYPFQNLEKGLHTLTVKAWDVYNNLVTSDIQFVVAGNEALELDRVLNYPNPFVDYTEFWFQHNRPTEPLQVQVQILTITGKIVKTINQIITTDGFLSKDIIWDGKDDFGDKIGKGVYIYKLKVKSTVSGQQAEKIEKLVIL